MPDDGGYELAPEPPRARTARPVPNAPARPCPACAYDLTGVRDARCPECGKRITETAIRAAAALAHTPLTDRVWFWPLLATGAGALLHAIAAAAIASSAPADLLAYLVITSIVVAVSVLVGWGVFVFLSMTWIGWSHSIPVTALQLTGAYVAASGASALLSLMPVPLLPWLLSCLVLVALLCKLLDLETNEAVALAIISWAIKWLIVMFVVFALMTP